MANIILVEASSDASSDLFAAVKTAASRRGVIAVSMSWGAAEDPAGGEVRSAVRQLSRCCLLCRLGRYGHKRDLSFRVALRGELRRDIAGDQRRQTRRSRTL